MRRERALWLASLGVAVLIMAVGVAMFGSGGWLYDRYEFAATKCAHGPLVIPGLSGDTITVDSRGSGLACNGAAQRAALGNVMQTVGVLFVLAAAVFLVVVIVRRPRQQARTGTAQPVARQSRPLGALLVGFGRTVVVSGVIGFLLLVVGLVTAVTPFRAVYTSQSGDTDYAAGRVSVDWAYLLLYVGMFATVVLLAWVGRRAVRRGRRHLQASAAELRASDPRPPVLYLRSFEADDVMAASKRLGSSAEEALVAALTQVGPVVALGEPGERLPPLGAARAYTPDALWQSHISDWAREARRIVLLAGDTPSFWWEVRHLADTKALDKAAFLLPGGDAYRAFRDRFASVVPGVTLPETMPGTDQPFAVAAILNFAGTTPWVQTVPPGQVTTAQWAQLLVGRAVA